MTEKLLKAKHWQIFLLTFGIPIIMQIALFTIVFEDFGRNRIGPAPINLPLIMPLFITVLFVSAGILYSWFWSVSIGMQSKIPEGINMKVKKFKIFFFTPIIYFILFFCIFILEFTGAGIVSPKYFVFIIPLHLFSMYCMFYVLYFTAKTFKTIELQKEVSFSVFAGEFFTIWFYPIGIWIIQPKINKMLEE